MYRGLCVSDDPFVTTTSPIRVERIEMPCGRCTVGQKRSKNFRKYGKVNNVKTKFIQ